MVTSVYEFNNTNRYLEILKEHITTDFISKFTADDSVVVFTASNEKVEKYGNAIHRDKDLLVL